ncbi:MAG: hypothetical protein M3071_01880 [Actinomycetota bacterium]|nr:hypothetical protein [Actinomycetota bacterium]
MSGLVDEVAAKVVALERDVAELRIELAKGRTRDDPAGVAAETFASELRSLLGDALIDPAAVRRSARLAAAEQAWVQRLGGTWDTSEVVAVLGVSKQRVSTLVRQHRLIALPRGGRLDFPAWQFAGTDSDDRICLANAHRALVEEGGIDPWSAASWFLAGHQELDDRDPVDWLRGGGDRERMLTAARRDAARAAQ